MSLTSKKIIKLIESNLGKNQEVDNVLISIKSKIEEELKRDEINFINRTYMVGYFDKEMKRTYKSNYYETEIKKRKLL
jgi:hypothetical protein